MKKNWLDGIVKAVRLFGLERNTVLVIHGSPVVQSAADLVQKKIDENLPEGFATRLAPTMWKRSAQGRGDRPRLWIKTIGDPTIKDPESRNNGLPNFPVGCERVDVEIDV